MRQALGSDLIEPRLPKAPRGLNGSATPPGPRTDPPRRAVAALAEALEHPAREGGEADNRVISIENERLTSDHRRERGYEGRGG